MKKQSLTKVSAQFEEIRNCPGYPSPDRLSKGKVAVIECIQDIPCNPCEQICPQGAIKIGRPITNLPVFTGGLCSGCGQCITICPGLAIFIVDYTYSPEEATVALPYELYSLPKKNEEVDALDREGVAVCNGTVVNVQNPPSFDRTAVVTVAVPKEFGERVRNIRLKR